MRGRQDGGRRRHGAIRMHTIQVPQAEAGSALSAAECDGDECEADQGFPRTAEEVQRRDDSEPGASLAALGWVVYRL